VLTFPWVPWLVSVTVLLVALSKVLWDYREGEAVVLEDIPMAKLTELHVALTLVLWDHREGEAVALDILMAELHIEVVQNIHHREPRKIQAAFDSDY
jgi:hypothetical protein